MLAQVLGAGVQPVYMYPRAAIDDQHQLRCYIGSRRQSGHPYQEAYEGCPDRLKLHDDCYIQVFTHGRAHGGCLSFQFFKSDGSAASYGHWKQRMETPVAPSELSDVRNFQNFGGVKEASFYGMRVKMITAGRSHISRATICSAKDLTDQDNCHWEWLTLEPDTTPYATDF